MLFAITGRGGQKSKDEAQSDIVIEEIDQLECIEDFVQSTCNFIPIGYVPTWFSKEKCNDNSFYI